MTSCDCPNGWTDGHREGCRFFGTDRIDRGAGNDRISGASGDQCGHGVQRSLYGYYSPYPAGWQEAKARVDEAQPSPSGRCEPPAEYRGERWHWLRLDPCDPKPIEWTPAPQTMPEALQNAIRAILDRWAFNSGQLDTLMAEISAAYSRGGE